MVLDEVVDARREGLDVGRLDGGEHADAQLVAAELAVAVGVDDPVGAQRGADLVGDERRRRGRSCRRRPSASPGRRRTASPSPAPRPTRRGGPTRPGCASRTSRGRPIRSSTAADRRAAAGWRRPACCTSGRGGCSSGRSRGRATPDASGRRPRGARCARRRPASRRRATARRRTRSTSAARSSTRRPGPGPTAGRRHPRWRRRPPGRRRSRPAGAGPWRRRSTSRCG